MQRMHCKHCGEFKPLNLMMKHSVPRLDGSPAYYATCKACKSAQDIKRMAANTRACACCGKVKSPDKYQGKSANCRTCSDRFNVDNKVAARALSMRW